MMVTQVTARSSRLHTGVAKHSAQMLRDPVGHVTRALGRSDFAPSLKQLFSGVAVRRPGRRITHILHGSR